MANQVYSNEFLSNEIEDQFNSYLDLQTFFNVDNSLVGTAGMVRKINVYSATDGTEKLTMGQGNKKSIESRLDDKDYTILLAQNRVEYYDEELMTDPVAIQTAIRHSATDMFNTVNADVYAELANATLKVQTPGFDFGAFVDAQALLDFEARDEQPTFAFVSPKNVAVLRKALKDDLKYVEAFVRSGYIGTVAGTNLYVKKDAGEDAIYLATKEAVTMFNKKGVEVEAYTNGNRSAADANIRKNTYFARKYYIAALTDATKVVKIEKKANASG